ncbi:phosphoglycerate dehydrogenase [Georgenia sp. MJ170]|uniref:phosphoglycerate dehydrogenase n=1 Tax=Georgenia sunbinii TaxID=3117728 RepID=UPI002F2634B6
MKVLLPDTLPLHLDVPDGVTTVVLDLTAPIPDAHTDAEVLVTWGQGVHRLRRIAAALPRLRWVQTLSAGPDAVLDAGLAPHVFVTSGRGLHDLTVAEHALMLILAGVRRVDAMVRAQDEHRWARELGGLQPMRPEGRLTTLLGARVVVWGFGSIGQTLAPYLRMLGADVRGIAQTAGARAGFEVSDDVDGELAAADVLVMVLPSLPETRHALDARRLSLLPGHAWVVNVGRGATIDEEALIAALDAGAIGGAALDVTETEPLPADSPLWAAPNFILSPHAAGGRPVGAERLLEENLAAFVEGRELRNVVRP